MMSPMFIGLAVVGVVLLVVSLVFDDVLDMVMPESDWISAPAIGAFLAALGVVGWMVDQASDAPIGVAAAAGAGAGVVLGFATVRLGRALANSPTDPTPQTDTLVGAEARVVTGVQAGGLGEVMVLLAGQPTKLTATSASDHAVGDQVVVVAVESSTKVVVESSEKFWS